MPEFSQGWGILIEGMAQYRKPEIDMAGLALF
jgi:hypothetical protein